MSLARISCSLFSVSTFADIFTTARSDNMTCLAPQDEDKPEQQASVAGLTVLRPSTCRVYPNKLWTGEHYEFDLDEGEEYFFVLATPTDPSSFAGLSDVKRSDHRSTPRSPSPAVSLGLADDHSTIASQSFDSSVSSETRMRGSLPDNISQLPHSNSITVEVGGSVDAEACSPSHEPESMEVDGNSSSAKAPLAAKAPATANVSTVVKATSPVGSFSKTSLDLRAIPYTYIGFYSPWTSTSETRHFRD